MGLDRPESNETSSPVAEFARDEAVLPRDVYALLAQANLLRMRGHWEDAAQKCMAALRLAPDSSSANSLLGDIYENQGRYDDAAQWYRMALDVNPDSPADRLKLDLLSHREGLHHEQSRPDGLLKTAEERTSDAAPLVPARHSSWLHHLTHDPELALRVGSFGAAFGLILIVVFAFSAARHGGTLRALGLSGDPVVKTAPLVVPPLPGVLPADPDAVPMRDPAEQSLLTALQGSRDLSALGIAVYDVQVDPRDARTTVTFGLPPASNLSQGQVARDALQVLQAAVATGQSPATFTARCLLISPSQATAASLAFVGDASRDAIQGYASAGTGFTDAQAITAFSDVWWSSTANIRG